MTEQKRINYFKEDVSRKKKVLRSWDSRFANLARKKGMTASSFCRRYKFSLETISRAKSLKELVSWKMIEAVEKAFEAEGV
jgi:hypothetical protein